MFLQAGGPREVLRRGPQALIEDSGFARREDGQVRHILAGLGAVPVHFACGNVDDVASRYLVFDGVGRDDAVAVGDVEDLVDRVGVALRAAAVAEANHGDGDGGAHIAWDKRSAVDGAVEDRRECGLLLGFVFVNYFHCGPPCVGAV